jgi:hypothetical protein
MTRHEYAAANNLEIYDDNADEFHAMRADYSMDLCIERCKTDGLTGFFARVGVVDGRGAVCDGVDQHHNAFDGDDGMGNGYGATMDEALAAVLASAPWEPIQYVSLGPAPATAEDYEGFMDWSVPV